MNTRATLHTDALKTKVVTVDIRNLPPQHELSQVKLPRVVSERTTEPPLTSAQQHILPLVLLAHTLGQGTLFLSFLLTRVLRPPWTQEQQHKQWPLLAPTQPRGQTLPLTLCDAAKFRLQHLTKPYCSFSYARYPMERYLINATRGGYPHSLVSPCLLGP